MKYKCVFHNKEKNKSLNWDTEAISADDALLKASKYAKENELYHRGYNEIKVISFRGLSRIGIKFQGFDTALNKEFVNFIFVLAEDKESAKEAYYDKYFGKSFKKVMTVGKGTKMYGNILETYYM